MPTFRGIATSLCRVVVVFLAEVQAGNAADRAWELRGELESLRAGNPHIVVLRLIDGSRIEIPLDALSQPSQTAVRAEAAALSAAGEDGVVGRGASGRNNRLDVPENIKNVEADAIKCRTGTQAADVYRLYLAGDRLTPEQRSAAELRARFWSQAEDKRVRLGDRWVPSTEAQIASDEAGKIVAHALELMRLGNADLAEDELRKASRLDPNSGKASFVAGLAYACLTNKPEKAIDYFAVAVDREPVNAAALNDLAVLEVLTRRHAAVARHFRRAIEYAVDPLAVAENIAWAVKLSGAAKSDPMQAKYRMPDKTIEELNVLYRAVTQELKIKPWDEIVGPQYLGPDGAPCTVATLADVATLFEFAADAEAESRIALGFVVAPGRVICPRQVITRADGSVFPEVSVASPRDRGDRFSATVVTAPEDGDLALLQCDALGADSLSLADSVPPDAKICVIDRSGDSWLDLRLTAAPGTMLALTGQPAEAGRFIHTAVVPRGLGGGPIIDGAGCVVGMVASTPRTESSGNVAGFGIPLDRIRSLLKEHAPDAGGSADDAVTGPAEAGAHAVAGTVVVVATTPKPEPAVAEPSSPP